jgi:hypothetical protein
LNSTSGYSYQSHRRFPAAPKMSEKSPWVSSSANLWISIAERLRLTVLQNFASRR